jgi:putative aldouronate transport system permease protein
MSCKRLAGERAFDILNVLFMILLMFIMLYPFWHVIMASFSDSAELSRHVGLLLWPKVFSTSAYKFTLNYRLIWTGYSATLFVVVVGTLLNVLMTSLAAYVISRKNFAARKAITLYIIFTMYFSGGLMPSYLLINTTLGLKDSLWALILPGLISTWNLLVMRTAFISVPDSIEESAKLDGANDFVILFRIILPTILSTVAVIILYYAVGHWNSWFSASIYIKDRNKWPLQLVLRQIIILSDVNAMTAGAEGANQENLSESIQYATIVVSTLPILCVYPFLQRYFVKGAMIGAVKG